MVLAVGIVCRGDPPQRASPGAMPTLAVGMLEMRKNYDMPTADAQRGRTKAQRGHSTFRRKGVRTIFPLNRTRVMRINRSDPFSVPAYYHAWYAVLSEHG
jgi:hypothetical protein